MHNPHKTTCLDREHTTHPTKAAF